MPGRVWLQLQEAVSERADALTQYAGALDSWKVCESALAGACAQLEEARAEVAQLTATLALTHEALAAATAEVRECSAVVPIMLTRPLLPLGFVSVPAWERAMAAATSIVNQRTSGRISPHMRALVWALTCKMPLPPPPLESMFHASCQ